MRLHLSLFGIPDRYINQFSQEFEAFRTAVRKGFEMVSEKLDAALAAITDLTAAVEDMDSDIDTLMAQAVALAAEIADLRGKVLDEATIAKLDDLVARIVALRARSAEVAAQFPTA